jgi:hypothetical protein
MKSNETISHAGKPKIFERLHQELKQYKLSRKGCVSPQDFKSINHGEIEPTFFWHGKENVTSLRDYNMS